MGNLFLQKRPAARTPGTGSSRWDPPRPAGDNGFVHAPSTRREAGEELDDVLADPGQVGTQVDQRLGGDTLALAHQPEEYVLGADVVMTELLRLTG